MAGINGDHASGAVLQKAIGESAGRSADIEADFPGDVNLPMLESLLQFQATAADVFQIFSQKPHFCFSVDRRARFLDFLPIDQNFAGENQGLGALTRTCQPAFQQQFIQAEFQIVFPGMMSTTKVPATKPVQDAEPTLD